MLDDLANPSLCDASCDGSVDTPDSGSSVRGVEGASESYPSEDAAEFAEEPGECDVVLKDRGSDGIGSLGCEVSPLGHGVWR